MSNADPIARSYPSPAALQAQIEKLQAILAERRIANERLSAETVELARTAGVLRAANKHLRGKLDAALLQRDEARESRDNALKQRDALEGIVSSLHERAVRATEALGVVSAPAADAE